MKQTAFRLTDVDLAIIDAAKRKTAAPTRAEALRYVLRYWAEGVGVDIERLGIAAPKPARRKTKAR